MKILFTAFMGENNSSKVLLDKIESDNKLYFRNSFNTSVTELLGMLSKIKYDLIISFGQAPLDMDTIKIETVGRGDKEYKTKYDYRNLKKKLDYNFKTIISSDAGNYLCNNIYFHGLKYIEENKLSTNMIFIHIPKLNNISDMVKLADIFNFNNFREIIGEMNMHEIQKQVWQNKVNKGFNTTDVNKEFCLLYGEVSEAYDAWKKRKDDLNEELADIAIYLMGLSEMLGFDLETEIKNKVAKNEKRVYKNINGVNVRVND